MRGEKRPTPAQMAAWMKDRGMYFISGKWYILDASRCVLEDKYLSEDELLRGRAVEIKDIDRWMLENGDCESVEEKDKALDYFKQLYGTASRWPPLPIETAVKNANAPLMELPIPMSLKQLKLINYLLRHDEECFVILTGVGGSGKSTFANVIRQIFDNDVAYMNLEELSNPFMLEEAVKHRLIYSDELNSDDIDNGKLKQLFSNQEITVNPKHKKPYRVKCQSAFLFSCNIEPRIDLCDTGMLRRIIYFSMNQKIKNPDPKMRDRQIDICDIAAIVQNALAVDMTDWKSDFEEETRYYLMRHNSVYICRKEDGYADYVMLCKAKGLKPYAEPKWEEIRALLAEWGMLGDWRTKTEGGVTFEELIEF